MGKISDSKRKFRIATKLVKKLDAHFGKGLRAVFVAGSVGSNLALHDSDIDVVMIVDTDKEVDAKNNPEVAEILQKFNEGKPKDEVHLLGVKLKDILAVRGQTRILQAAVPIFGSKTFIKWAQKKGVFQFPDRESIRRYYRELSFKEPDFEARISKKKNPKRFRG